MKARGYAHLLGVWAALCLVVNPCIAQTITGSISGNLTDASGAVIPDASVTLQNELTGETRKTTTSGTGDFLFPALPPGQYAVSFEKAGFKAHRITGLMLSATQRLALSTVRLAIGELAESVTVTQQGESINLESADSGGLLSSKQLNDAVVRGRDVMNLLRVLPV